MKLLAGIQNHSSRSKLRTREFALKPKPLLELPEWKISTNV
jgi:hypothetical protein